MLIGKTVANKTLWLMNVKSPFFTMRHLIMGLGRVQQSSRVCICPEELQEILTERAKSAYRRLQEDW